jgi:hypothetical protein
MPSRKKHWADIHTDTETTRAVITWGVHGYYIELILTSGLHVDLERIWRDNLKKEAIRKNGSIINQGDNPTKEERSRRIEENRGKYSIESDEV